ncbi:hypothetical protein H1D32_22860 [Anaerobacillus sp. CMMVII]|uniref:hypothetical protein n=1 Tax=Anaerobacillus sp. CMMVII TaxID=2755588 RepID=UPI0021B82DB4|nr:hypothetical protein [Anaerobacillus sp. CMMVII]MCT8140288.1 hypothetical protein [Anaerobacillus sp. CMMVII]
MKLRYLVKKIVTTPPQVLIKKGMSRLRSSYQKKQERHGDLNKSTYHQTIPLDKPLTFFTPAFELEDFSNIDEIREVTNLYLNHYFEVLGSGWVQQKHGMKCRGVEGHVYEAGEKAVINAANLAESEAIRELVSENYIPIDWQLDFKSGFRWREDTWYKDISYGHLPGVDIKVPWELARMHHLTQLAFAYYMAKQQMQGFKDPDVYAIEFRNQVLDFIAANPPRFGVNWFCSMDVAIRASNWLVAYDLFHSFGATFDQEFDRIFPARFMSMATTSSTI